MGTVAITSGPGCPSDDQLFEDYCRGTLPEDEAAGLEEHLLICESCRQRVGEESAFSDAMRGAAARWRQKSREPDGATGSPAAAGPEEPGDAGLRREAARPVRRG